MTDRFSDRPRVLHVTAPAKFGGLESVVSALTDGHRRRGFEVCVAAILDEGESRDHPFLNALRATNVQVVPIDLPHRAYLRERRVLRALIERTGAEIVHTHGPHADIVGGPVARRAGASTVSTVHGFTGGDWKIRLYERIQVRLFRRFDAVVAVSLPLRDRLRSMGVSEDRLYLLPNAMRPRGVLRPREEARSRLGIHSAEFHVGWIGRLSREKGPDLFLEALGRVTEVDWVASVIGDGPERAALVARSQELGIDDRVRWHGNVPEAGRLMKGFDVLVLSSRTEGTPIVLLEAMAAGVPIVATAVGGVPDLVGDSGLLAQDDLVEGLASGLRHLRSDRELARELGRRGRERFDVAADEEGWLEGYEEVYRRARARCGGER